MRALLIANALDADPGCVGERFVHHGFSFVECLRESPGEWPELAGHDLVLMLGSEWSVYWPKVADSVSAESALVRAAAQRGVPLFGICFGSQVMAHALGGRVERACEPEIGWYDVQTDEPSIVATGPWLQWHYDVVALPPAAVEMARSAVGPQAWRVGRAFATQFHPEATETILERWTSGHGGAELEQCGTSAQQMMAETRTNAAVSREHADGLVDWYLAWVHATPREQ